MRIQSVFCGLFLILLFNAAIGQQTHDFDLRFAPTHVFQAGDAEVNASTDNSITSNFQSQIEFELGYSHRGDSGQLFRARIGHLLFKETSDAVFGPSNTGKSHERLGKVFLGFGIGHSFSSKFISIQMGLECALAWQYRHSTVWSGNYLNRQGNLETQIMTTEHPREVTGSLLVFSNLYLNIGKRISTGIEFRQPVNLIFIRGVLLRTEDIYDAAGNLMTTQKSVEQLNETRLETDFVFSPLLGIRFRF